MNNPAIITAHANLYLLGREVARDMLLYTANCQKISDEPLLFSFAIPKKISGLEVLNKTSEFVIHFMDPEFLEKYALEIQKLSKYEDPLKTLDLSTVESVKIECPKLESIAHAECEKVKQMEMGDSMVFIGRVLYRENL